MSWCPCRSKDVRGISGKLGDNIEEGLGRWRGLGMGSAYPKAMRALVPLQGCTSPRSSRQQEQEQPKVPARRLPYPHKRYMPRALDARRRSFRVVARGEKR
jgi:hypothetical protein